MGVKTVKAIFRGFHLLKDIAGASPWRIPLEILSILLEVLNSMVVKIIMVKWILDMVVGGEYRVAVSVILLSAAADLALSAYESWMKDYYRPKDAVRIHEAFQNKLYRRAVSVKLCFYDDPKYYDRFLMAARNSDATAGKLLQSLREFFVAVAEILISGGLILSNLSGLLLIVLIPSTLYMLLANANAQVRVGFNEAVTPFRKKMDYVKKVFFTKGAAVDLRTTGIRSLLLSLLNKSGDESIRNGKPYTDKRLLYSIMQGALFYFQYTAILAVLAWRALKLQDLSVGDFSMLMTSALTLGNNWRFFGGTVGELAEYGFFSGHYYEFLQLPAEESGDGISEDYSGTMVSDVSFTYPESEKEILNGFSMKLKKGQKVAIVGQNGAGKSTMVSLILGFYVPDKGEILQNGRNLEIADRESFSLIFQDSRLYPFTLAENLLFHAPENEEERLAVSQALKKVGLWERVKALPEGMDTPFTKEFDNSGAVFSGGEAQRLMLARALIQERPVFIMDEPVSAQDPKAESELNRLLTDIMKDKTLLMITHRLSTLSGMDYIYLIEGGRVLEEGSHEEMMQLDGRYAHTYRAQSELYSMED